MSDGSHIPLSERLRPTEPRHLLVRDTVRAQLEAMLAQKRPVNMTFCGPPGHGKTSTTRMIINSIDAEVIELQGSDLRTAADVRDKVISAASTVSLWGKTRIIFIDEIGGMTKNADRALRIGIEKSIDSSRFILCANDAKELSEPILSRCPDMRLLPWPSERDAVLERWIPEYKQRLRDLQIDFDDERVTEIVYNRYPDLRAVANQIELEFCL